jgi:hypothetical protein
VHAIDECMCTRARGYKGRPRAVASVTPALRLAHALEYVIGLTTRPAHVGTFIYVGCMGCMGCV